MNEKQIRIRIGEPSDREKLRSMLARSSPETIYKRFHIPFPEVPGWMIDLMLVADHHECEVAVAVDGEQIIGHAMYVRVEDDAAAEMAIIVEDGWQSMGVGASLLGELARLARLGEIEAFTADVLGQNLHMLGLARRFSGTVCSTEDGVSRVSMPLIVPELAAVRRAA